MKHLLTLAFACFVYTSALSQSATFSSAEADAFDRNLREVIQRVAPSSVRVVTNEKLTPTGGVSASGVSVTADGIIMTAGHLVIPGGKYEIIFPDGRNAPAKGLGKVGIVDLGLLKITEEGSYPFSELGSSSDLKEGEGCFSIAYPGSFLTKSVVRFGYVRKVESNPGGDIGTNHILTTCLMEPGDSGGPLFDMNGKVIGIRSYIGLSLDENYEVPVDMYRKYWNALLEEVNYRHWPEEQELQPVASGDEFTSALWPDVEQVMNSVGHELSKYAVEVKSDGHEGTKRIFGALIDPRRFTRNKAALSSAWVVSKSSELGNAPKADFHNRSIAGKVVYRDERRDLALVQFPVKGLRGIVLNVNADTISKNDLGTFLISPLADDNKISVLGTLPFSIANNYNVGFLGLKLETVDGKNVVTSVQKAGAADMASIKEGDELLEFNGKKIQTPESFVNELKTTKPHQLITLLRKQGDKTERLEVRLQQRPFRGIDHVSEEFTDGRSERRDDFESVFIHDARLKPSECGGPVFDLKKNFIGINTARYSRISSLVIPAKEVDEFLKEAFLKPGK